MRPPSRSRRFSKSLGVLYPAILFSESVARFGQTTMGRVGRWLGLAMGAALALPAFAGGILFLPMQFVERCFAVSRGVPSRP
jgi:hypothetical protein